MIVNRIWLIIITFALMITLTAVTKEPVAAGVITMVVMLAGYIAIAYCRGKKRLSMLEEKCDPQSFIEATEKQMRITGKNPKINAYLTIDKAAGFIAKGEFQKAKDILNSIDKSLLSLKNGTLLVYTINLIGCSYELGEMDYAEELFETQVPLLAPVNRRMVRAMELLVAERFFYLKKYKESKERFQKLFKEEITRRHKLEILFRLAQIDEANGDIDSAKKRYKKVSENGGELWVAVQAANYLDNM